MIIFWFKEAFKSISRSKSSFFLTLISLTLAVILIEASITALKLSEIFQKKIKSNINVSLFINDPFNENNIKDFKLELSRKNYIKSVKYVSKDDAAKSFIRETGEDFREILDYNPLPASFVVNLNTDFVSEDSLNSVINNLSSLKWVDEVVFKDSFVYRLLSYLEAGKNYLFITTAILILIAVYLVYSTIKLITNNRMKELETMKLVGAKLSTIKMPIILNGLITGLLASIISIAVYYIISLQVDQYYLVNKFITVNKYFYVATLLIIGPVLSLLVTVYSLRKLTLKI